MQPRRCTRQALSLARICTVQDSTSSHYTTHYAIIACVSHAEETCPTDGSNRDNKLASCAGDAGTGAHPQRKRPFGTTGLLQAGEHEGEHEGVSGEVKTGTSGPTPGPCLRPLPQAPASGPRNTVRRGTPKAWDAAVSQLLDHPRIAGPQACVSYVETWDAWNECIPPVVRRLADGIVSWQGHPQRQGALWSLALNSRHCHVQWPWRDGDYDRGQARYISDYTQGPIPTSHPGAQGLPTIWALTLAATVGGFQVAANLQKVKANGKDAKPSIFTMRDRCEGQYSIPRHSQLPETYLFASTLTGEEANLLARKALSNLAGTIAADNKTLNLDCMPVGLVPTHVQGSPCVDMYTHRPEFSRSTSLPVTPATTYALTALLLFLGGCYYLVAASCSDIYIRCLGACR